MDLFDVIEKRHSYRGPFENVPVKKEDLEKILWAGVQAPSGKNAQTTNFVAVDEPLICDEIRQMNPHNSAFNTAQAYILCFIDEIPEKIYEGHSFQIEDCAAAVENMLLAITALGYGSVWIDGWLRVNERGMKIAQLVAAPIKKKLQVLLPIGVPQQEVKGPKKLGIEQRVSYNLYSPDSR